MDRTTRTLIVVAIAVAVAAAGSFGVYRAIQQMPVREIEVRSVSQVVAVRDMEMGTLLTANDVKLVPWPASSPVTNGFTSVEAVVNRGLISAVFVNEPLIESKLAPVGAGAGLPPSITEGMRALSIRVNEVVGVAGFVVPGTRVDVLVTLRREGDSMTRVVVTDVQVLTAGTRIDQTNARDGQPIPTSVVTLLLLPADAERVTLASSEGGLMLTLRNPLDRKPTESKGVRTAALFGDAPPPPVVRTVKGGRRVASPPPPPQVVAPVPKVYTVETIRAAQRSEQVIR